jgi:subtilisin
MATSSKPSRFILLPSRGVQAGAANASPKTSDFLATLHHRRAGVALKAVAGKAPAMRVIESVHEDGAKLVAMRPADVVKLRAAQPGLRIVPEVFYYPAVAPRPFPVAPPAGVSKTAKSREFAKPAKAGKKAKAAKGAKTAGAAITVKVVSKSGGAAIKGCMVVAFTDFANRIGASGTTNAQGQVALKLGAASKKIERLYVYSPKSFWNGLKFIITLTSGATIKLVPIDLGFTDGLRHFYGNAALTAGKGITVGVIDTGISAEPDLAIQGGFNAVTGENPNDFGDNGEGHGTHVAGIIAARGTPPAGIRGLAPAVTLRSYRVFGKNKPGASNFDILKALDRAVTDGCDLVNMSLGSQGAVDAATHDAISNARSRGTLVFAASGNDDRIAVGAPARDPMALAVTAMGRKGTYPPDSVEAGDVMGPFGTDKKNYVTSFSNIGPEVDLTAPGDGIISTFPQGYAVLDGTSMACPAAVGAAAKLLAGQAAILAMARNQARSDAMAQFILQKAKTLGFPADLQGQGML